MLDKLVYNTVLSQTLSPCGRYLLAGNIYGQIAIFDVNSILNPPADRVLISDFTHPVSTKIVKENVQINSLLTTDAFLIIGTVGEITGYQWKSFIDTKPSKPSWVIKLPLNEIAMDQNDINCLILDDDKEHIYAGCGDGYIYKFKLDEGRIVRSYGKHENFIHSAQARSEKLISASEDGTVKLWDARTEKCQNTIEPHKNSKSARPDLGKWIGAVDFNDDWIVCGGGPRLSLWHLRSLDLINAFDLPDRGIHVASFIEDKIFAGGCAKCIFQLNYSGDVSVELPVSCTTVYSMLIQNTQNKLLSFAGSSTSIDLCTSFNYRDQVLHFK